MSVSGKPSRSEEVTLDAPPKRNFGFGTALSQRPTLKFDSLEQPPPRATQLFSEPVASEPPPPPLDITPPSSPAPKPVTLLRRATMRFAGEDSWAKAQVQKLKLKPPDYSVKSARRLPEGAAEWALIGAVLVSAVLVWALAVL